MLAADTELPGQAGLSQVGQTQPGMPGQGLQSAITRQAAQAPERSGKGLRGQGVSPQSTKTTHCREPRRRALGPGSCGQAGRT